MTARKLPETASSAPVVQQAEWIRPGTIITQAGTEYYVQENGRGGSLELIRLSDLREGYRANVYKHNIKAGRDATEEERGRIYTMMSAKLDALAAFREGAIVKPNKPSKHFTPGMLFVITKVNAKTVSISQLGGGVNLNSPTSLLDIVKPEDVLK